MHISVLDQLKTLKMKFNTLYTQDMLNASWYKDKE